VIHLATSAQECDNIYIFRRPWRTWLTEGRFSQLPFCFHNWMMSHTKWHQYC